MLSHLSRGGCLAGAYPDALGRQAGCGQRGPAVHLCPSVRHLDNYLKKKKLPL
jgi:hypothetical protein